MKPLGEGGAEKIQRSSSSSRWWRGNSHQPHVITANYSSKVTEQIIVIVIMWCSGDCWEGGLFFSSSFFFALFYPPRVFLCLPGVRGQGHLQKTASWHRCCVWINDIYSGRELNVISSFNLGVKWLFSRISMPFLLCVRFLLFVCFKKQQQFPYNSLIRIIISKNF